MKQAIMAACAAVCCAASAKGVWLKGETDRDPLGYRPGETMPGAESGSVD